MPLVKEDKDGNTFGATDSLESIDDMIKRTRTEQKTRRRGGQRKKRSISMTERTLDGERSDRSQATEERFRVFYLVEGRQGATGHRQTVVKNSRARLVGGALSTLSSTPANYHLSQVTSPCNQFLEHAALRPEFQNFSGFPVRCPLLEHGTRLAPPVNRAPRRAAVDEERKAPHEDSSSGIQQTK